MATCKQYITLYDGIWSYQIDLLFHMKKRDKSHVHMQVTYGLLTQWLIIVGAHWIKDGTLKPKSLQIPPAVDARLQQEHSFNTLT